MEELSGMTALVTGSTDGVGRLVARKLGQAAARVLVHGRDAERGARVIAEIKASGGAAKALRRGALGLSMSSRIPVVLKAWCCRKFPLNYRHEQSNKNSMQRCSGSAASRRAEHDAGKTRCDEQGKLPDCSARRAGRVPSTRHIGECGCSAQGDSRRAYPSRG
jgi:NAD(P)-dependent dehydrogenase (short-subunit alcohol dehydrogenase family)